MVFIRTLAFILCSCVACSPFLYAQQGISNYEARWKLVDSLTTKKGFTQSALEEVNKIYALAKKEKQDVQLVKALVYQASLEQSTIEDADNKTIARWQQEIETAAEPARSILQSILAEKYYYYFQQHRWQLYNRTQTTASKKDDITTWNAADFHEKITALYQASLQNKNGLQQTTLDAFDPIIIKGNARYLRPTLFDLLANRALEYFKTGEQAITKPAYSFELNEEAYYAPAAEFAAYRITNTDTSASYYTALVIYQQLLAFHLRDAKPAALIDANIQRLEFVQQHSVMENKDALYEKALLRVRMQYEQQPAATQASYLIAQLHANKATLFVPLKAGNKDTSGLKDAYIIAANICRQSLQQQEESEGRVNCYNLLQQIQRKELNLVTEKVNLPQQPFRTLVSYRNFSKLYFRLALLTDELAGKLQNRYDDGYWKVLVALQPLRSWAQSLPANNDYQKHSAEVKVDPLPVGKYILLASASPDFSLDKNPLAAQYFYVSGISYINNNDAYFILDRQSGKPLAGATVQVWQQQYDYTTRRNKKEKLEKQTADKNGYFRLAKKISKQRESLQLEISYHNDRLFMDDQQYIYYREEDAATKKYQNAIDYEIDNDRLFLFTDRSIYRPGQTIYFKGIGITKDFIARKTRITADTREVEMELTGANGQTLDSVFVKFNEYGSFSGRFRIPDNVLTGEFNIKSDWADESINIAVEEYKRPKFFVDYEKIKEIYKVNDSIRITGFAKSYAGSNIDGAQVKYRVQRVARFVYPWLYWRGGYPRSSNMEITNGIARTDASGRFTIIFKAIPDRLVSKDLDPIFDYKITADITDLNGETRTGETTIPVSYKALQLKINLPELLATDSLKKIPVRTQNLQGGFEPALVKITISKLQAPARLIRKRYWPMPDQFTMTKEEFVQNFPDDAYADEDDYRSWPKEKTLLTKTDSSCNGDGIPLGKAGLPQGWYVIEASTHDKNGEEVKDIQYVQLYDEKSKEIPGAAYSWSFQKNNIIEPGERSSITVGSSAPDVFLIQEIDKTNPDTARLKTARTTEYHFINLNGRQDFDFSATEADRGGFAVYHFFVKNNRFYSLSNGVAVPWTNKALKISYETFRDKTLPGSEEKWKLKISGYKNEQLAAEVLVSMYDASLDQFKPHRWNVPGIWDSYSRNDNWSGRFSFEQVQSQEKYTAEDRKSFDKTYDFLNTLSNTRIRIRGMAAQPMPMASNERVEDVALIGYGTKKKEAADAIVDKMDSTAIPNVIIPEQDGPQNPTAAAVQIRRNFNETAFFFPDLKTDSAGNLSFGFTIPEALTQWKFQALAHTKNLAFGYSSNSVVTQKPLMVQPNAPRFLREGDKMELSAMVSNLTDNELTGTVELALINTSTNEPVDGWFNNMAPTQFFTAAANGSTVVKFSIAVPYQYTSAVSYRFVAKAGEHTDGEEAALPVLTNRMLVTESLPLPMRGNSTKNFRFEKLLQSGNSETLQQHALTVTFTTNPAWYAVQALTYLMEYPYECAEQTFNRYYANSLAAKIIQASPRLQEIFNLWKTIDTAALLGNLQKNPELKSVLLEETPWVMEAKTETQQKKNIALLFDLVRMGRELSASLEKLKQLQAGNGGFTWFKGGPDDRYMTQYILSGIGHLKKLGALNTAQTKEWTPVITSALGYLDQRTREDYDYLVKHHINLAGNNLTYTNLQYLYMRSFFMDYGIPGGVFTAVNYYRKQSQQYWLQQNRYGQGMIALSLSRSGDNKTAHDIMKSLKENATVNEEMGMYWKDNIAGYYWHQAPVETQCLMIEAFSEINKDAKTTEDLKTWLLKQKQVQDWKTTRATADACYALLLQGSNWLNNTPSVEIKLGNKTISSATAGISEAGTGYFQQTIQGPFVQPTMGEITVKISSAQNQPASAPAWGAVYWQYFEQLDKITPAQTPLKLERKLFIERNSARGPVLYPITENGYLKVGDKIKVRIELRVDRDMEYIHMKDMRASCLEPANVLSGYKWQDGLGYYETTRDASTNFFFNWLPKGTYVFEYPLFVTHAGNFSNGVTSIQCMYAPEFTSHSEGLRINAEENK
ncbi:MAG: alpha-2-macroglobulin family protein [Bacteroidota bacterium]